MTHICGYQETVRQKTMVRQLGVLREGYDPFHKRWKEIRFSTVVRDTTNLCKSSVSRTRRVEVTHFFVIEKDDTTDVLVGRLFRVISRCSGDETFDGCETGQ
jgi:hypothetical protein